MQIEDVVKDPKVGKQASSWAFVGFLKDKKGEEFAHPIGVFGKYADGRVKANSWLKCTMNALRWEAMQLHEEGE